MISPVLAVPAPGLFLPGKIRGQKRKDFVHHRLVGRVAAFNFEISLRVKGAALGQKTLEHRLRIIGLQKRAVVAAQDALKQKGHGGVEPERDSASRDRRARARRRHSASPRRKDLRPALQDPPDDAFFPLAKIGLPMLREHIFDRHTRGLFDFGVRIDKGQVQRGGEAPAYRRLARPHHANKNDAAFLKGAPHGPRQGLLPPLSFSAVIAARFKLVWIAIPQLMPPSPP